VSLARRHLLGGMATVAALVAGVALPAGAAATAPAAPAIDAQTRASPAAPLLVTVTSVGPAALTPDATLTVRGTVRNTTARPARSMTVSLRVRGPLATRAQVAQWRDAGPLDDRGFLLQAQQIDRPVAAGSRVPF
jgi:Family of unknown function (DUF6049)